MSSAAALLSKQEASDLAATANGLPDDWCVQLVPPHGQLAIVPFTSRDRYLRCWVGFSRYGYLFRERRRVELT